MPIQLPCHACSISNRIPEERLTDGPKCGKCGAPLLPGVALELNEKSFRTLIAKSDIPVIVDFWAEWCGPCKMMAPAFEQAAGQFAARAILGKLDTEQYPALAQRYNIRSIPTLIAFKGARELTRQSGALDLERLRLFIEGTIK